jgi:GT2 family glycosyltransferase
MFSIIIPIKNQFEIVKKCLHSVYKYYKDQDVIIVDDGSNEEKLLMYLQDFKKITNWLFYRNETSQGHTKACELGIASSANENMFLLNSDTIVTPNSLHILSKVLDENKDIAVVGPTTSSASGPQMIPQLYSKRFTLTIEEIERLALEFEKDKTIQNIDLVNGFCFGIKKSVFNSVGKFDERLTAYGNEKELLVRIRKANFRTVWVKGAYVHHFGKMSYAHENLNIGQCQKDADNYIFKKYGRLI